MTHLLACGSDLSYIALLTISSARSALWSVASVYPTLSLLTAAVDEVRHGQLIPGIHNLEQRWEEQQDRPATTPPKSPLQQPQQPERIQKMDEKQMQPEVGAEATEEEEDDKEMEETE